MFQITLFGGFQLSYRRQAVDFAHRPRLQSLLAYLALNRHAPQSRIEIIHALWPDAAEDRGRNRLRNLLYHLRKVLPAWETLLDVGPTTFGWRSDAPAELDIARFDTQLALAAAEDDPQRQASHLTAAVDCYAGDLFPSCVDEWIAAPRALFRNRLLDVFGRLIDLTEARQDWDAARQHAEHLLAHDPLHEATYRRIMQLQARKGDTDGIERTFARCRDLLAHELDVAPDAATQSIYAQLTASTASSWTARRQAQMADKPKNLVGRAAEWASLQHTWQQVQDGDSRLIVVQGEAGIGKTRLCQDFRHWVAQDHTLVATANCYAVEGTLAFAPVAEWLRAEPFRQSLTSLEDEWLAPIARLRPELKAHLRHASVSTPVEERLHRQQFFHALALALLGHSRPVLLCLDDLQWCDQETLDWLHYLIRHETRTPLLVLATLRTDDAAERARCRPLLRELARHDRLHEIQLKPLSRQDTATLAQHLLGDTLSADSAARLHQETDGNPFYITETVQARPHTLLESNSPTPSTSRSAEEGPLHLPPRIRALIEERLARLSPLAREVMQYAAVIGRRFDYAVLAAATTHSEEALVRGMEELWAQRIVREAAQNHFDFVHDKLRMAAYAQINPVRRRFLHRRIADALDAQADEHTDEVCLQIAQH
ncbi:MAG: AAA family ATPase, partial [Caldilineaceae bacterium]|nr:AAA family ATPase [Caldilineaceae bacterium]